MGALVLGRKPFLRRGHGEVTGPGLHSTDSTEAYPKLQHHTVQAGYATCPW